MLLAAAMAASLSITSPPSPYLADNLLYTLEATQGEMVMYVNCDEASGRCYAKMETYEAWFACDVFNFECVVTRTQEIDQSI